MGVIYAAKGQNAEEAFANVRGSTDYNEFISSLGWPVCSPFPFCTLSLPLFDTSPSSHLLHHPTNSNVTDYKSCFSCSKNRCTSPRTKGSTEGSILRANMGWRHPTMPRTPWRPSSSSLLSCLISSQRAILLKLVCEGGMR